MKNRAVKLQKTKENEAWEACKKRKPIAVAMGFQNMVMIDYSSSSSAIFFDL